MAPALLLAMLSSAAPCLDEPLLEGLSLVGSVESPSLLYVGPEESDIGRQWPMTVSSSTRRRIVVRLGTASVPSDPGGATLPAFGANSGAVKLPALRTGSELVVVQGQRRAVWRIEVSGDSVTLTPKGTPFVRARGFSSCAADAGLRE